MEPHPQSEGAYGDNGTIMNYLCEQDAAPFMEAADRYYALLQDVVAWLSRAVAHDEGTACASTKEIAQPKPSEADQVANWFDIDSVVEAYIVETGASAPETIVEKTEVHITAVKRMIVISAVEETHE
jgi:hypothetical protein